MKIKKDPHNISNSNCLTRWNSFFILFLFSLLAYAQTPEGFNYQSVVRNASGDVISNSAIGVQFKLHKTTTDGTVVYTETHAPTTNAYGVFDLVVGQGTSTDDFSAISWSSDSYFLEVSVDTEGGTTYVSMGTTQLLSVPYALHAARATTAENVSGLEAIDEGNGTGWRLIDSNSDNYGNIGNASIDLSISTNTSTTNGAIGSRSIAIGGNASAQNDQSIAIGNYATATTSDATAIGPNATATGINSLAIGRLANTSGLDSKAIGSNATAQGLGSFASGFLSNAIGTHSVAFGNVVTSNGDYSYSLGNNTTSDAYSSFVVGRYNVGGGTTDSWVDTDALLEVGNGTSSTSKSNALIILKNGTIIAPSFDLAEITDDKALITKEYADANLTADNLGNHTATENIQIGGNWISNDGDDEGLLIGDAGRVTTSNKLFLGSNINLDTHWINGDGTSDNGIQFDASGNVITSAKVSLGGNMQLNNNWLSNDGDSEGLSIADDGVVVLGGNVRLNNNWLSNDGGDEGIAIDDTGNVTSSGELAVGGNIKLNNNWLSNDGGNEGLQIDNNGNITTSGNLTTGGNFELSGILTSPSENQIFGSYNDTSNLSNLSDRNVIIGHQAAEGAQSGRSNVVIGYFAGYNINGDSNVLIGTAAGAGGTFSNQLHIRNLIYGEFDNDYLEVNGELKVDENITTDGNVVIDADGDDLRAAGAANNVEMISLIISADGSISTNVTGSSGITTSLSDETYTINYNNHFSGTPAVTITCLSTTARTRIGQIITLGQGKVTYKVKSENNNSETDAMTIVNIVGKR